MELLLRIYGQYDGSSSPSGSIIKKMVTPIQRKQVVKDMVSKGRRSERQACQLVGISRSSYRYQSQRVDKDRILKAELLELAKVYPRFGYLMLHGLLKNKGLVVNNNTTDCSSKAIGVTLYKTAIRYRHSANCSNYLNYSCGIPTVTYPPKTEP